MLIDEQFLNMISAQAKVSPRLRMNYNFQDARMPGGQVSDIRKQDSCKSPYSDSAVAGDRSLTRGLTRGIRFFV